MTITRKPFIAAAVAVVALLTVGIATAPASAATGKDHVGRQSDKINATIEANGGTGLAFGTFDPGNAENIVALPRNIEKGGSTYFRVERVGVNLFGPYATAPARIYYKGSPTEYWVAFYASTYWNEKKECTIYLHDPSKADAVKLDFSPFECSMSDDSYSDPWDVVFKIAPRPTELVTDPTRRAVLIAQSCGNPNAQMECGYLPTSIEPFAEKGVAYGNSYSNHEDVEQETKVAASVKRTATNSVKVETGLEVEFADIWKASLTIAYGHEEKYEREFGQTFYLKVPPHSKGWLTMNLPMERIHGEIYLRYHGKDYRMEDTIITPDPEQTAEVNTNHVPLPKDSTPDATADPTATQ
jgi:hypothetical protein